MVRVGVATLWSFGGMFVGAFSAVVGTAILGAALILFLGLIAALFGLGSPASSFTPSAGDVSPEAAAYIILRVVAVLGAVGGGVTGFARGWAVAA